jgi:hypothetical protein
MINKNINANYCHPKTSVNNQNKLSYSLKIYSKIRSIVLSVIVLPLKKLKMSFKSSNCFGYDEVCTNLLKHVPSSLALH